MFIDRKDIALALALAPVTLGCTAKESTTPVSLTLPTSTPILETVTSIPTTTPPPPELPKTPTPESTSTPEPKPQVKLPGERGMTYTAGLRQQNRVNGAFFLFPTPEDITPEGIIVGYSTIRNCNGQPSRTNGAFFIDPNASSKPTTERSIKFQRPNAILDSVIPTSETRFFGNFTLLAGGSCDQQEFNFIAEPTARGLGGIENASLQVLRAIEMRPGSATEATEILFRPCRQCLDVLNAIRASK